MNKWQILEHVLSDDQDKVPSKFWEDREFVLQAVHWNGFNFKYASKPAFSSTPRFKPHLIDHEFSILLMYSKYFSNYNGT